MPACKSLDCISVMAGCIEDVDRVLDIVVEPDDDDPWSRARGRRYSGTTVRLGLPPIGDLEFFGDTEMQTAHLTVRDLIERSGWTTVEVGLPLFLDAGALPYEGPWVAERLVEFADFLADKPDSIHPVVRDILRSGERYTATDAFRAQQRLQQLRSAVGRLWRQADLLVVPTIGTTFTVDEVLARPIECNTMLGHYTHFGNLLDLVGVAVPMGLTRDGRPVSVMNVGPALSDDTVLQVAATLLDEPRSASDSTAAEDVSESTMVSEEP